MSINTSLNVFSEQPLDLRAVGAGTTWAGKGGEVAGLVRFDTTAERLKVYDGGEWREIVDSDTYSVSAHNGGDATNKFLRATNADGSEGEWVALNENAAIQIVTNSNVTANSLAATGHINSASASCTTLNCPFYTAPAGITVNNTSGVTNGNPVTCLTCDGSYDGLGSSFQIQMDRAGGSNGNPYAAARATLKMVGGGLQGMTIGDLAGANAYLSIKAARSIDYSTPTSASYMGHYFAGFVFYFNSSNWASDDRLKWEEVPIANGLSVINRLQPQVYWKGNSLDVEPTPTERRRESGFIAQEVEQIPELAHAVRQSAQDDVSNGTYCLDYAQLHAYQVAATQELHTLVGQQRALIEALTARVAALET